MWVYLWNNNYSDYSAMQWPAPNGFHVPSKDEWQSVYDIWTALWGWSSDWTNFWTVLKLPFAWYRNVVNASIGGQNTEGVYRTMFPASTTSAQDLRFSSSQIRIVGNFRGNGYSIRCFKNEPINPISNWEILKNWRTWLYHTSWQWYWIAHNSSEGLISISSNWQTWITIADKNLWATTVWNSWDTLSEANCWKYYQRWNNYGFSRTWSVATSSTQVDASWYWPWNYYSSSTFITRSSSPFDWSSAQNDNLWWWVTWVKHMSELKNAYIGEYVALWIYHNATLWLISLSSDGSNWLTIADKNLWATQVYNSWDTLSEANCGKYFQWGNNYGFPFTWSVTTSGSQVNASNYWPWNYYSSSTFRLNSWRWDTTDNWNLWGGVTWTNEAMQWPAPSGFHVPLPTEWKAVYDIWTALGGWGSDWTNFGIALKLPFAGLRNRSTSDVVNQGVRGRYWSSTRYNADNACASAVFSNLISPQEHSTRAYGFPVRPFKNEAVQPDDSRTKLY